MDPVNLTGSEPERERAYIKEKIMYFDFFFHPNIQVVFNKLQVLGRFRANEMTCLMVINYKIMFSFSFHLYLFFFV